MPRKKRYAAALAGMLCTIGLCIGAGAAVAADPVSVTVAPDKPLIEQGKHQQLLNCDFRIKNTTGEKIELSEIEVSVLGAGDKLIAQYRVGANGASVLVVPNRFIEPGETITVFNPLYAFPEDLELSTLRFDFRFDVGDAGSKYRARAIVHPQAFTPRARLVLPVQGPVLVHDGHDFYGHHRRVDMLDPMAQALKWKQNFMRYSYDFVVTDEQGRMYRNDGSKNEDWFGWGKPVLAPASGKIVRAVGNLPDNVKGKRPPFSREQFIADPALMWGNHVVIDHGNGEFSLLAHLKQGSVTAKPGDAVKGGQQVGEMGFSGDAFLVHLHYDLKTGPGFEAEGLPSPFHDFERLTGRNWRAVARGQVDSGDIVRGKAK
ncbi:MAG TPA: M23 family metallopeptidase [Paucimonas sp.]|nr:M23 family metallopeptidase [Paucimonas sp.]